MFKNSELSGKVDKDEYVEVMPARKIRLGELQRLARQHGVPSIIVFEGGDAAGKGETISRLINPLDPRGFDVFPVEEPDDWERRRPFFWRFWTRTPARGRMAIFSRSWYHRTLVERRPTEGNGSSLRSVNEINDFERTLDADGCIIEKFFLHISKKEQKARLRKLENDPATRWMVTDGEWEAHKKYDRYLADMEWLMGRTDTPYAPWTVVEAGDLKAAELMVYNHVIDAFEKGIAKAVESAAQASADKAALSAAQAGVAYPAVLDQVDLTKALSAEVYKEKLKKCQERAHEAQCTIFHDEVPAIVVFEGWDAAGKGGDIKRLMESLDPRRYTVVPVGPPSDTDKAHHYLWRFWQRIPPAGHLTIFDRSWYGRVLVERVEGLCRREEWQRAYGEINEMEKQLVEGGAVLVKLWLHIDKDTQLKRFEQREADPDKEWKITGDDWRNRGKWDQYRDAVEEMLARTSTKYAPWTIIESDDKYYSRIKTLETVVEAIEQKTS